MFACPRQFLFALSYFALFTTLSSAAVQEPYDLVIRGGKIVDGSGNPWFRGDVAIRGDRIAKIGRVAQGQAEREIDAAGSVVSPVTSNTGEFLEFPAASVASM